VIIKGGVTMKKLVFVIAFVTVLIIFGCSDFKKHIEDNKDFVTCFVLSISLVVAFVAVCLTAWTTHSQTKYNRDSIEIKEKHDRLSVKPMGQIYITDYEDKINVTFKNNGIGPLVITSCEIHHEFEEKFKSSIIDWMPSLPENLEWRHFTFKIDGWSLLPAKRYTLIELEGDPEDKTFTKSRDKVREILKHLRVEINYQCIYKEKTWTAERSLRRFGRVKNG
jgi:hypothetical protein